jgi:hypothetical protein
MVEEFECKTRLFKPGAIRWITDNKAARQELRKVTGVATTEAKEAVYSGPFSVFLGLSYRFAI